MLKNILYNTLMMAGIVIVLVGGAALAYKASEPKDLKESADGYYEIYTAYDYERFWRKVTHNMPFVSGRLMTDICLNDMENYENWEYEAPVRKNIEVPLFAGDFDGNGHTVYGLYSENGYGMVEKNEGKIHDVIIKNSLVTGDKDLGGICLYNDGIISRCEFAGELKSLAAEPDAYSRMAGISMENKGMIKRCGYRGEMTAIERSEHRRKAGISTTNGGEIVNCYNFTWEDMDGESCFFYSIANHGEKSCFVREDVRWKTYYYGQILSLDGMQQLYLAAFLDKDLYTIYLGMQTPLTCFEQVGQMEDALEKLKWGSEDARGSQNCKMFALPVIEGGRLADKDMEGETARKMLQEIGADEKQDALRKALLDENVCDLLWSVLVYEGINWESVVLEGGNREDSLFEIQIYNKYHKEQQVGLAGYRMESGGEKNPDAIWDLCSHILMEENKGGWEDNTWRISRGGFAKKDDGYFILYQTKEKKSGFFYTAGEMLYQVKMQGENEENQRDGMENVRDLLTVKIWINSMDLYHDEKKLVTDKTQFCNKIWGVMVEKIWEGKIVGYVY